MKLHLVDINLLLVNAWKTAFKDFPEVDIQLDDILNIAEDTIVSPANSFGYMDGGIDLAYMKFFGPRIQIITQNAIRERSNGQLPVGSSLIVETGRTRIPYMIVAPTMKIPGPVPAENAYRAMRAVLRIMSNETHKDRNVYCPGLATLTGRVPIEQAADKMAEAYRDWKKTTES